MRRPLIWAAVGQSNSPAWTPAVKADHSAVVTISAGPAGSFESRTARCPPPRSATSTQLELELLRLLLRHLALDRSVVLTCLAPLPLE